MISEKVIKKLINEEYEESVGVYEEHFVDYNHGFGVIHEEFEETFSEIRTLKNMHDFIDQSVTRNDMELLKMSLGTTKEAAIDAIQELIQVAAMADKFLFTIAAKEKENVQSKK